MEEFDENLEEKYKFIINTDENFGGTYGNVYSGSMYKENDIGNKIPIVLKTCTNKAENEQQQQFKKNNLKKNKKYLKRYQNIIKTIL